MDESVIHMPPCCVGVKLPKAIMAAPHRTLTFYTEGNVLMEAFHRAVSYLVDDPYVMVLTMPTLERETLAYLQLCFERGWVTDLVLSTSRDYTKMVDKYLTSHYPKNVIYRTGETVTDMSSHMVLYNEKKALTLCGPMLAQNIMCRNVCYNLQLHLGYGTFSNTDHGHPLRNVLIHDIMRFRSMIREEGGIRHLSKELQAFIENRLPTFTV